MNKYFCSDGSRVSESTIQARYSKALREWYPLGWATCEGCGGRATESSHIIAKARCKELHKTELIWSRSNVFPACRDCHRKWEAISNPDWCYLKGAEKWLKALTPDQETYQKRLLIWNER